MTMTKTMTKNKIQNQSLSHTPSIKVAQGFVPTKLILISTAMGILLQEGTNFKLVSCWSIILQFHDLIKKN